jgi:hypothetical protein
LKKLLLQASKLLLLLLLLLLLESCVLRMCGFGHHSVLVLIGRPIGRPG